MLITFAQQELERIFCNFSFRSQEIFELFIEKSRQMINGKTSMSDEKITKSALTIQIIFKGYNIRKTWSERLLEHRERNAMAREDRGHGNS